MRCYVSDEVPGRIAFDAVAHCSLAGELSLPVVVPECHNITFHGRFLHISLPIDVVEGCFESDPRHKPSVETMIGGR